MPNDNSTMGERFDERFGRLMSNKDPDKFVFVEEEVKSFVQSEIDRAVGERERGIRASFIDYFFGSGERWYAYGFEDDGSRKEALEQVEEEWDEIISLTTNQS